MLTEKTVAFPQTTAALASKLHGKAKHEFLFEHPDVLGQREIAIPSFANVMADDGFDLQRRQRLIDLDAHRPPRRNIRDGPAREERNFESTP